MNTMTRKAEVAVPVVRARPYSAGFFPLASGGRKRARMGVV